MPEYPDIIVYIERLRPRIQGQVLERVRLASPFLLRTVEPAIDEAKGKKVLALRRLGKRIVLGLENDLFLVLHLMIAGRLHWKEPGAPPSLPSPHGWGRVRVGGLAALDFSTGSLTLTEAGTKKRVRCTWCATKPPWPLSIRADWKFWKRICRLSRRHCSRRTTRSSEH